jgi:hypothetical protein
MVGRATSDACFRQGMRPRSRYRRKIHVTATQRAIELDGLAPAFVSERTRGATGGNRATEDEDR